MSVMLWLLLGGVALATASELVKRRAAARLPDVPDEDFLRGYRRKFGGPEAGVLEERKFVARHIGLPARKLSPEHRFGDLSKYTGFVSEYEVGVSDLEDELAELCQRAAVKPPPRFPATVGEYINEMLKARRQGYGES